MANPKFHTTIPNPKNITHQFFSRCLHYMKSHSKFARYYSAGSSDIIINFTPLARFSIDELLSLLPVNYSILPCPIHIYKSPFFNDEWKKAFYMTTTANESKNKHFGGEKKKKTSLSLLHFRRDRLVVVHLANLHPRPWHS